MAKGRANDRHIRLGIPVAFVAGFCLMILQQAALARGSSDNNERRPTTTTNTTPAATPRPNDEYPIPLPYDERCPWLTDGVLRGFARWPLMQRTQVINPFGPGSWPPPRGKTDKKSRSQEDNKATTKFGYKGAVVLAATVRIKTKEAERWLPTSLLRIAEEDDTAIVFILYYPDSYCCGDYHEAGILLNVLHVASGKKAVHCPWMLVDSDQALVAGRGQTGFPKMIGQFTFTISSRTNISDPGSGVLSVKEQRGSLLNSLVPGATVSAEVRRDGTRLLSMSGRLSRKLGEDEDVAAARQRYVFLNVQTLHPMPYDAVDSACLGNRPRLVQYIIDESNTNNSWSLSDPIVVLDQTQTDAIGVPFGIPSFLLGDELTPRGGWPLEVANMTLRITNFFTGEEAIPRLGETVPSGRLEDDMIYWLRNK